MLVAEDEEQLPDDGDEAHDDERLRDERVRTQRQHDRVDDLDQDERQEHLVEQIGGVRRERGVREPMEELVDGSTEECRGEQDQRRPDDDRYDVLGTFEAGGGEAGRR